jgi:hypothetical protein
LEFFRDGLPEKKLQLVGMSILLILLSPELGCYNHLIAIEDKGIITNYELLRSKVGTADWIVVGAYHYACMI